MEYRFVLIISLYDMYVNLKIV